MKNNISFIQAKKKTYLSSKLFNFTFHYCKYISKFKIVDNRYRV
jgi:hypothetical protein